MKILVKYSTLFQNKKKENESNETNEFLDFCLDAKVKFDDNAEFRQKEVFGLRDTTQEDKSEVEAAAHNLVS